MTVRAVISGITAETPIIVASRTTASIFSPLSTARTVIPRSALEIGRVRERWHRIAVSSAKQCGRAIVPEIGPPERLTDLFEAQAQDAPDVMRLQLIEPAAASASESPSVTASSTDADGAKDIGPNGRLPAEPSPAGTLIAIGPEGGWAPEEVEQAREAGWQPWTLGARTLRAESAPLAALSILTYAWRL